MSAVTAASLQAVEVRTGGEEAEAGDVFVVLANMPLRVAETCHCCASFSRLSLCCWLFQVRSRRRWTGTMDAGDYDDYDDPSSGSSVDVDFAV